MPWGEALLDPITEELHRRQAQADQEKLVEMRHAHDEEQQNRLMARDAEKAKHDREVERLNNDRFVGEQTIREGDRRAGYEQKVRDSIARGDIDAAEQMGAGYQSMDAKTGAVSKGLPGFKIDRGIKPSEPAPTDDVIGDAVGYAGDVSKYNDKQAHPDIMLAGVHTTPDALRYSAGRANAADMKRVEDQVAAQLSMSHDPHEIEILKHQLNDLQVKRVAVEQGLQKPGDALRGNDSVVAGERKQAGNMDLANTNNTAKLERTKVTADAMATRDAAKRAAKDEEKAGGADPKAYARVQSDLSTFDKQHNISTDRAYESRVATLLDNKDSTIVQRAMAANLARGIGAEKGVLTDKDITRLQGNLGGYWSSVENWLSKGATGDLADDVKAKLVEGLQVTMAEKAKDRAAAEKAYAARFLTPTYVGHKWGFTNDINNAFEEKFGHPYQPPAQATGGAREPSTGLDAPNGPHASDPLEGDGPAAPMRPGKISREDAIREARRRGLIK